MKKNLLVLFCAVPFFAFSQSNFKTSSVTTKDGSVLPGYINYREWGHNPETIQFKTNLSDSKVKDYTAGDLESFSINDLEAYLSYTGRISMNHTEFPNLSAGIDSSSRETTIFLKQLVKAQYVNLYVYTDSVKTRYFVQEQQGKPVELLYQKYLIGAAGSQIKTVKSYTGYLIYLAGKYRNNDSGLISSIEHSDYNTDIIKLVGKINGGAVNTAKAYGSATGVRYYVGAAYSLNKFNFHIPPTSSDVVINKSAPALNLGIDIFPNKNIQKFFIRTDVTLSYTNIKYQEDFDDYYIVNGIPYNGNFSYVYNANLLSVAVAPQVVWNFYNTDKVKLYVDAGLAVTIIQYGNQKMERIKQGENSRTLLTSYNFGTTRVGFPVQIGTVLNKRYEIYATYQHRGAFKTASPSEYNLSYNTISLGFHWLLY